MPAVDDVISGTPPLQWGELLPGNDWVFLVHNGRGSQANVNDIAAYRIDDYDGIPKGTQFNAATLLGVVMSQGTVAGTVADPLSGDPHYRFRGAYSHTQIYARSGLLRGYLVTGNSEAGAGESFDARNRRMLYCESADDGDSWTLNTTTLLPATDNLPSSTGEAGHFSSCAMFSQAGEHNVFYGAMNEFAANQVNTEIRRIRVQTDGVTAVPASDEQIFAFNEPGLSGAGDEIWPLAVFEVPSGAGMYYSANGFQIYYIEADDLTFATNRRRNVQALSTPGGYMSFFLAGQHQGQLVLVAQRRQAPDNVIVYAPDISAPDVVPPAVDDFTLTWNGGNVEHMSGVRI